MYFKKTSINSSEFRSKAPFYPTFIFLSSQSKNTVKVHRVFPSRCFYSCICTGVPNSIVYCKRTVWKSLSRYMHVGTYPTRNFSYLRTSQGYGCLVVWAICLFLEYKNSHSPYQTRGRHQTLYFRFYVSNVLCFY